MTTLLPDSRSLPPVPRPREDEQLAAQPFVARLRSAAASFAAAAGAQSAVVREAVPPARHRRGRCRLVLRFAAGTEADVALPGPAGRAGSITDLTGAIGDCLTAGRPLAPAWLVT